jgi:hypothetical protein
MENDSGGRKQIVINPEHFRVNGSSAGGGTRRKREQDPSEIRVRAPPKPRADPSRTMKRNALLKFIRRHQANNYQRMLDGEDKEPIEALMDLTPKSELDETLSYLMEISDRVKEEETKNRAQYGGGVGGTGHSYTVRSHTPHIQPHEHVSMSFPDSPLAMPENEYRIPASTVEPSTIALSPKPLVGSQHPQYGCLKGGSLPTYRNYMQAVRPPPAAAATTPAVATTQIPHSFAEQPSLSDIYDFHEGGDVRLKEAFNAEPDPENIQLKILRQRRTNRRTFHIGKHAKQSKVGVLVSNRTLRKSISTKAMLLKQTPIDEVRKFLVKKNLIAVGSSSPAYVLRNIYENAKLLCGEVYNHNNEMLVHNFFTKQ